MRKLALRGLRAHLTRLLLTTLVVVMGVCFVAGGQVMTDTVKAGFDKVFTRAYAGVDAVVRSSEQTTVFFRTEHAPVTADLLDAIGSTPGVAATEGLVRKPVRTVGHDGQPVCNNGLGQVLLGMNWIENQQLNQFVIDQGSPPANDGEVVIDKRFAREQGLSVGDQITVLATSGPAEFTVSGIAKFQQADDYATASVVLFRTATAQWLLLEPGRFDMILVAATEGTSQTALSDQLRKRLAGQPKPVQVLTGKAMEAETKNLARLILDAINRVLLVFGVVALFVATFIIYNTFSLIVAQRTRELALIRAIGASRRQVVGSLMTEAALVGLVASVLGIAVGIGLGALISSLLIRAGFVPPDSPMVLRVTGLAAPFVMGFVVTTLASLGPAWRASTIPPVAAMRETAVEPKRPSAARVLIGAAIALSGAAAMGTGLFADLEDPLVAVGTGMGLVFVGLAVLAPAFTGPASRFLGSPLARLEPVSGKLARENAARSPRRTAATASAVMVGVTLVSFIAIIGESLRVSTTRAIDGAVMGDFVIDSRCSGLIGVDQQLAPTVAAIPGIAVATGLSIGPAKVNGSPALVFGVDPTALQAVLDIGVVEGDLAGLANNGVGVPAEVARENGWGLGTPLRLSFLSAGEVELRVSAIYSNEWFATSRGILMSKEKFNASFPSAQRSDFQVYVKLAESATPADVRTRLDEVVAQFPPARTEDLTEFKRSQTRVIDQFVFFVWALLLLAVVISVIGILNTLLLSVYERTREIGLLRAAGMTRRQVRSMIRSEAVIITLIGTLAGLFLGMSFAWALVRSSAGQGVREYAVPFLQLAIIVGGAWLASLLAASWPARRAANLDLLTAIAEQ
ncbi:MAG: FtsX-like permease family protein [Acidimicrobiales bacterium]|nr:FtsX-like permease family protein [Acidimicrobiales bacterium]